jgi:hypothetical protein
MWTSRLQGWNYGTYTEVGRNKLGDMGENGFEDVVSEFAPQFENRKQVGSLAPIHSLSD